jgi:hypothetical protein
MIRSLLLALFLIAAGPAIAQSPAPGDVAARAGASNVTTFTIVTTTGYVSFDSGNDWSVFAAESRMPVARMAFQIPDTVDLNTPDSTNLVVGLYQINSATADEALEILGRPYGEFAPATTRRGAWTIVTQDAKQGGTLYTVMDAKAPVADVRVGVRLAWPHLPGHAAGHDSDMQTLFFKVLDSIKGGIGPYKLRDGEVLRRPTS